MFDFVWPKWFVSTVRRPMFFFKIYIRTTCVVCNYACDCALCSGASILNLQYTCILVLILFRTFQVLLSRTTMPLCLPVLFSSPLSHQVNCFKKSSLLYLNVIINVVLSQYSFCWQGWWSTRRWSTANAFRQTFPPLWAYPTFSGMLLWKDSATRSSLTFIVN